ncbi:MAG TPA: flagellar biosynthesis regulatory protein FlaF [Hyphomonadaceae bacterium]|nr:flagellar biosynthesis regulatory protein FlaF [Hyphomonadaceae bacterium]
MSIQAYQKTANKVQSQKQIEYRAFAKATGALSEAKTAPETDFRFVAEALDLNRRLWSLLAVDCANPENKLPEQTRASIISLSIYVRRHSSLAMRNRQAIDDLIEINRRIMAGLAASPPGSSAV